MFDYVRVINFRIIIIIIPHLVFVEIVSVTTVNEADVSLTKHHEPMEVITRYRAQHKQYWKMYLM